MWDEPAGLTMLECIACGTPLITTVSGGIPEYVYNNCILIDKNNVVKNIEKSIMYIINDNYKFNLEKGIEFIKNKYCPKEYLKNFYKIINK